MKIKQKIIQLIVVIGILLSIGVVTPALAAPDPPKCSPDVAKGVQCCAGVKTTLLSCDQTGTGSSAKNSGVWGLLILALNILTAGIGIAAVGGVVYAAILYTTASDRADQVKKAKDTLQNIAIGIAAYGGMYLLLNFLIPGGIFS
jgi:hypothetical protein